MPRGGQFVGGRLVSNINPNNTHREELTSIQQATSNKLTSSRKHDKIENTKASGLPVGNSSIFQKSRVESERKSVSKIFSKQKKNKFNYWFVEKVGGNEPICYVWYGYIFITIHLAMN
jgi:spore germination protein GerM